MQDAMASERDVSLLCESAHGCYGSLDKSYRALLKLFYSQSSEL